MRGRDRQINVLDALAEHLDTKRMRTLETRIKTAIDHFDCLTETTVAVGRLKPEKEYIRNPIAAADPYNRLVYVPIDDPISDVTLFHELAHLDIRLRSEQGDDVPTTSEKYCSIYAIARMPEERIDRDRIAYLGYPSEPRERWPDICRQGLEYREKNHNYIQQTRKWLGI